MARTFNGNAANRLTRSGRLGLSGWNFTFACWAKPADLTTSNSLINLGYTGGTNPYVYFWLDGSGAGAPLRVGHADAGLFGVNSSNSFNVSEWNSCVGIYQQTSRTAWLNGTKTSGSVSSTTFNTLLNTTGVGVLQRSSSLLPMNGDIAWVAVWNVVLTDDESAAYCKGVHPFRIRPESLVAFWPLAGLDGDEPDWVGGYTLTETGTVAVAESRPLIPYRRAQVFVPKVAGAGGATIIDLTSASFGFTGSAQQPSFRTELTRPSLNFNANSIQPKTTIGLAAGALNFTANAITVGGQTIIELTQAAFNFTANTVTLIKDTAIQLTTAAFNFVASAINVSTPPIPGGTSGGGMFMALAGLFKRRRYRQQIGKNE